MGEERPEDEIVAIDEIEILGEERPEDEIVPIDEIEILGVERPEESIVPIDEIEILGKERVKNIIEPIDEIQIEGKLKPDNIIDSNIEIEISGREDYNTTEFFDSSTRFHSNTYERKLKYNLQNKDDNNYSSNDRLNNSYNRNLKLIEIHELKKQVENERESIKDIVKKIFLLENELSDENKNNEKTG